LIGIGFRFILPNFSTFDPYLHASLIPPPSSYLYHGRAARVAGHLHLALLLIFQGVVSMHQRHLLRATHGAHNSALLSGCEFFFYLEGEDYKGCFETDDAG
jgi:hypothetical protein